MAIRKYIGKSITSKNTKKRNMSRARNTPIMLASRIRKRQKYPLTCLSMPHDARQASRLTSAVNSKRLRLMPSTPRKYSMLKYGIHALRVTRSYGASFATSPSPGVSPGASVFAAARCASGTSAGRVLPVT
jgi:hypothetical protein